MMANTKFVQLITKITAILLICVICDGVFNNQFIASEAEALLEFKNGLNDPSNLLSSWTVGEDCCHWNGVGCDTTTGHVISLNLRSSNSLDILQGQLSPSLLKLSYLSYLNLGGNDFMQSSLPSFLGTMKILKHLDLSHANFKGSVLDNLGNLSLLESLDLSGNSFYVNNLKWLCGFSSLKTLDLSGVYLDISENDWFHDISTIISSLKTLRLSGCGLNRFPTPPPPKVNFNSLITLDLSINHFSSTIPDWLFESCHHLQYLNLSNNNFHGHIPYSIERMTTLITLDLSHNLLVGSIPPFIDRLVNLVALDLSHNMLNGSIPSTLDQAHGQSSLKEMRLSGKNPSATIKIGTNILSWIGTNMQILEVLILRRNSFDENIPKTLCMLESLLLLDLSENQLRGEIPRCVFPAMTTDESINDKSYMELLTIKESLSLYLSKMGKKSHHGILKMIDFSSNYLTQGIPVEIAMLVKLNALNLSGNQLEGSIPSNIGEMESLEFLDLSRNHLSCVIPTTMVNIHFLVVLNLSYNTLSGKIPSKGQFQTFSNDSYIGNPHLCGSPLTEECPKNSSSNSTHCLALS